MSASYSRRVGLSAIVLARVPLLVLAVFVFFIATRRTGQVEALFDTLSHPFDHAALIAIVAVTALLLGLLTPRPRASLAILDFILIVIPPACLTLVLYLQGAIGPLLCIAALVVTAIAAWLVGRLSLRGWIAPMVIALLAVAVWAVMVVSIATAPVGFPRAIGTLAIAFIFVSLCLVWLQFGLRRPWLGAFAGIGLLVVFFAYHETHLIRTQDQTGEGDFNTNIRGDVSLQQAIRVWVKSRNDVEAYVSRGKPYPVFIVTSEGGGGYAAAHANLFLSKLQQRCPNFAQHVFALVGVSGGSVGNTQFHAALPEATNIDTYQGCTRQPNTSEIIDRLAQDHLSPVVAALLFHDLPNKLLFGALGDHDRSEALAASLSAIAWKEGDNVDQLYWDHFWRDDFKGSTVAMGEKPALIYVATNAVSGKRYVFAPFAFPFNHYRERFEEYLRDMNWPGERAIQRDVRLIDGAVASASFPWVTPSRVLAGRDDAKISLVDGGYLENSGAETVRDIIDVFMSPDSDPDVGDIDGMRLPESYNGNVRFDVCDRIEVKYAPPEAIIEVPDLLAPPTLPDPCAVEVSIHVIAIRAEVPYLRSATRQSFFLDPLTALLSARSRRAETARFGLLSQLCGNVECPEADFYSTWHYLESVIATDHLTLPLGWFLPASRLTALDCFVAPSPDPQKQEDCGEAPYGGEATPGLRSFGWMTDNPHTMTQIESALDPGN